MERREFIAKTGILSLSLLGSGVGMQSLANNTRTWKYLGQPCRNFNILATTVVHDPYDGREKFVLSNFAEGEVGSIILIDTGTGKGENFPLPVGAGAWGLVNWHNEKIIVGTCVDQAYLHVFDLKTHTWAKPIVSQGEAYFWQMDLASDDKIYGGTYPGCNLTQYDPRTNVFKNLGKISDNPRNQYSRPVYGGMPGYVFVWYGFDEQGVAYYDITKERFGRIGSAGDSVKEANAEFVCLENKGKLTFYSAKDLTVMEDSDGSLKKKLRDSGSLEKLADGRWAGVRGQEYYIMEGQRRSIEGDIRAADLKPIPVDAMPTCIFNLTTDGKGLIWGSCAFGLTIFKYNPKTGKYWNSPSLTNRGGEVYGMVFYKGKLYTSAYVGGEHSVYDPSLPWNAFDNVNPRMFADLYPKLVRPEGRSVMGPDGCIWTGWSAGYGIYGGALSRVQPDSLKMDYWYDPIAGQQLAGLTADGQYLYFTTNGGASGLPYHEGINCHFAVWKPGTGVVRDFVLEKGETIGLGVLAHNNLVALVVDDSLRIYDPAKEEFVRTISLGGKHCSWLVPLDKKRIGAFAGKKLLAINIFDGSQSLICDLPGSVDAAMVDEKGRIYFSVVSKLYSIPRQTSLP